ncbi:MULTISPECIES: TraB/GumN family protein [unclassified Duganella]|uniref:TraB/GumN family protein n=1 Tax=unclassified Duganella TaxID=2636909 RepID=UPI000E34E6B8|nr:MULTISPECIES: TraB/GumN family protein [unclassified Duganella]RFP08647.1 TraB/GumN family protein [Duganella sp. BJB475]RFP27499.1 TraB/GumN family protein [Duganella sp. BJB476]
MPKKIAILFTILLACCQALFAAGLSEPGSVVHRGQLYRVTHDGKTSYLFGTIHVGKDGFYPLDPVASRALLDSKALVIELDIRQDAPFQLALARHGRYPDGDTVQRHLSPAALRLTVQALARAGMSLQSVQQYKPWLIANLLIGAEMEVHGFQRSQAVEYALLAAAKSQDKAVRELESADYQLSLFDTLDERQQEQYLLENLADLADGASLKKSTALIDAWNAADAPAIRAAWQSATSGDTISAGFMNRVLLGKRNPEMANNIERIMQQEPTAFVGVGLLHLVGDDGLPQLLRKRGYQVEQLY